MADVEAPAAPVADPAPAADPAAKPAKKRGRKPKEGGRAKAAKSDRPPTMQLITKAIASDKDPKGSSVVAIKKFILANYKVKSSTMLNHMLKRALTAGMASGKLARPKGQAESSLLVGRYRLAKEDTKKPAAKPKKAKSEKKEKKTVAKKPKAKIVKKPAAKKAKSASPKKVKKAVSPKKPAAKKTAAKKSPKKTAKK